MAKPKKSTSVQKTGSKQKTEVQQPIAVQEVKATPRVEVESSKNTWELKDRIYVLRNNLSPLSYAIKCSGIFWFDEEKGYERELKYTKNQKTPFVDEFAQGTQSRLEHIVFEDGVLYVPKEKQVLQKLLSLYHPQRGKVFEEFDAVREAVDEVSTIEKEIEALMVAKDMDIDMAEAIMRVELGSKVSEMSSKEIKRDLLVFAKRNPMLFLELANDENVNLRNIGIKAVEMNLIRLSADNRTFHWASNDRKLMTVPFNEHPYSALAAWFKTDEGLEVFSSVEKQLN
tara:strand:+ start:401 stop:1255 length:855 start_codon:yes stop_codon:yes gene_type:complete